MIIMYTFEIPSATPKKAINHHWQFCVGSGQAKLAVRADYGRQLKFIHDELGIQRVRFHGIFDDSMQTVMGVDDFMPLPGAGNFTDMAFNQIGAAYDNVLSAGMQPWVELSFMPSRLAKNNKKVTVNANGRSCMPKDNQKWIEFIQSFIRYLLTRYGAEEVEQWYFEVWNEPNMSTFFSGSKEDYFHLYDITARAVKSVDANIKVGGPATAVGEWIGDFIAYTDKQGSPVDFISTHFYPGDGIGDIFLGKIILDAVVGGMKRMAKHKKGDTLTGLRALMIDKTEETEYPKGQMYTKVREVYDTVGGRYPIYFTEWNANALLTSESNETRKPACYQIKSASEMDGYLDGSSVWCFSDAMDEFMLLPDEFPGYWGFVTQNGIPRPQFWAMKLLKDAGCTKYELPYTNAEVEIDLYEEGSKKTLFVYRERMKNVDEPKEAYEVKLELEQAPTSVTLVKIDEDHCNPYRVFREIGSPKVLSPQDIAYIKEQSAAKYEKIPFRYENGILHFSGDIGVNDIHCFIME